MRSEAQEGFFLLFSSSPRAETGVMACTCGAVPEGGSLPRYRNVLAYLKVWQGVAAHVDRCVTMGNPTKQPHVSVPITNPSWGHFVASFSAPRVQYRQSFFPMTPLCFYFIFNLQQKSHRPFSPSFSNRPNQCACTRSLCVSQHQPAGHSALSSPTTPLKGPKRRLAPRPCDVALCRLAGLGWAGLSKGERCASTGMRNHAAWCCFGPKLMQPAAHVAQRWHMCWTRYHFVHD